MIPLVKSAFFEEHETRRMLADFIARPGQLSFGPECQKFEERLAAWQGRKQCVFMNSGSSANLALIQALLNLGKLKRGDMVGFSALTWSTNVMPLLELGLVPVPIDIELDTLNVSSKTLKKTLDTSPLKGLFLTNILGFCDDIDIIRDMCAGRDMVFFEDNCESFGTVYRGRKLGNFGLASTFSFYIGHHLSTIEGGAVCTDDEELARSLRLVRAHGWDRNLKDEEQEAIRAKYGVDSFFGKYTFYEPGYNFRPTEINGFLGNVQMQYADRIVAAREKNFRTVAATVYRNQNNFFPIRFEHIDTASNFAVPVVCRSAAKREELIVKCKDVVEVRPLVGGNIARQPFFKKYGPEAVQKIENPNADIAHNQGLYFGNNPELTDEELQIIINVFS